MSDETEKMAPTASIETVIIVRPLKVVALLLGFLNVILLIMVIGASAWVGDGTIREGLWEVCVIEKPGLIDCQTSEARTYIIACRYLCLLTLVMDFVACLITAKGLQATRFRTRYRCYYIAMLVFFLGVMFNVTALIIYPIKYSEEMGGKNGPTWSFGWAYGLGWGATVLLLSSALLLCLDKDADEIVFRERLSSGESGIEEESLTEVESIKTDKSDTASDLAYADDFMK